MKKTIKRVNKKLSEDDFVFFEEFQAYTTCACSNFLMRLQDETFLKDIPMDAPIDHISMVLYVMARKYGFTWKSMDPKSIKLKEKHLKPMHAIAINFKKKKMLIIHVWDEHKETIDHVYI